jgi:hypothetical protein
MYCQMMTVAQAFLAFLAVLHASSRADAEASTPTFAGVADPAARAALRNVQRELKGLSSTVAGRTPRRWSAARRGRGQAVQTC